MALSKEVIVSHPYPNVVKITLNRPASLNAINVNLLDLLLDALREHASARVIVLEGSGDRSFCAGEDLKQTLAPKTGTAEELRASFTKLQDITRLTSSASAVIVAVVQGFAIGGGAEIALAADFVVGGPNAKLKFPEATIGHAVTGGISLRLVQMVGLLKAKELLMLGEFVGAEEAHRIGLLTEIAEDPKERALQLAIKLASLPVAAVSSSKTSVERAVFPNMENVLYDEVNVASYCFAQSDATQAFSNFANRKKRHNTPNGISANVKNVKTNISNDFSPPCNGQISNPAVDLMEALSSTQDINTALENALSKAPNRCFLRFGENDITFKEFHDSISALAGGLKSLGLGPGDRVLVMMRNSIQMVHMWIATNRLGATWVPINIELKSLSLQHVIQAAEPKIAIVDPEFQEPIVGTGVFNAEDIYISGTDGDNTIQRLYNFDSPVEKATPVCPSTTSAFLYTSGTTGKSKPCILSHQYFILQATALIKAYKLRQDDVLYCPFPLFHADATALTVIPAILLGATAALSPRFSVSKFWHEIKSTKATVYDFMGATLAFLYKQAPSPQDRDHNVRLAWGVPIPAFAEDYERRFGHPLYTLYGSVEANIPITQKGTLVPGSCGTLSSGYQMRIANEEDEPLPPNTVGQLLLRSDQPNAFFHGYFNSAPETVKTLSNLWLHTGDLAKVDEYGNVFFVGRIKDVIRRRGENVNASEIEEEFLLHPDVMIAAAIAVPSSLGSGTEDEVKVVIKLCDGSVCDEEALWEWATQNMARFQVPSVIELVNDFKRTPTGKLEKRFLQAEGGKRFDLHRSTFSLSQEDTGVHDRLGNHM